MQADRLRGARAPRRRADRGLGRRARRDRARRSGSTRARFTVVHHGAGRGRRRRAGARGRGARALRPRRPARVVLCVGAMRPHKNQELLVGRSPHLPRRRRARARRPRRSRTTPSCGALAARARRRRAACACTGYVDDAELEALWRARRVRRVPDAAPRASGCRCSRRCGAACRSPAPTSRCCARSAATSPHYFDPHDPPRRGRGDRAAIADPARGAARPRSAAARSPGRPPRAAPRGLRAGAGVMHVGLNLVFLVPGETGGMEVAARELIPALRGAAPGVALHRVRQPRGRAASDLGVEPSVRAGRRAQPRRSGCAASSSCCRGLARARGLRPRALARLDRAGARPLRARRRRSTTSTTSVVPDAHFGAARRSGMRVLVPLAARRSHRVIADSESHARRPRRAPAACRRARSTSCRSGVGRPRAGGADAGARAARAARRSATGRVAALAVGQAAAQEPARGCSTRSR